MKQLPADVITTETSEVPITIQLRDDGCFVIIEVIHTSLAWG